MSDEQKKANKARMAHYYIEQYRRLGWDQFDTNQDAHYFGIWVHLERRLVLS